jgi:ABC-2 type transport system permease protein
VLAGAAGVLVWGWRALPAPDFSNGISSEVLKDYASQLLTSGPLPYLLYPFRLVVRPYQAADWAAFAVVLWPAVLLLALHYVWVTRMDVAFEEASLEVSRKLAERVAAVREGRHLAATPKKAKRPPFQLHPTGPPAVALLWKNLISAGQGFSPRVWVVLVAVGIAVCIALGQTSAKQGVLPAIGLGSAIIAAWLVLFGPHVARMDFRQDLPNADILKAWPLRGWQVVLGETLAPAAVLAAVQWFLILVALVLLATDSGRSPFAGPFSVKLGAAFGAALLLPALNVISLLIINAAVLLFPAWLQSGREGPQGIEATGQRLIFALGQLVAFTLALAPAAGVFAAVFFVGRWALPLALTLTLAAVGGTIVLGLESALGVMLVGRLFERLDLSTETNP